jgi:thioredoxin 1
MAANLAISAADFEANVLKSDVPVLVDFWATWCRPCLAIAPAVEEIATEVAGQAKVYKLDVDEQGEIASQFGVLSIPTLIVFKDGQEVERITGARPKEDLKSFLMKHI